MSHDSNYAPSSSELSVTTDAALECLAWSEHVWCLNRGGVNAVCYACAIDCECIVCDRDAIQLPEMYDAWFVEWSQEARETMRSELSEFIDANNEDLHGLDYSQIGYDFTLTRNGHGAGFWDRGLGERGERLSDAARAYGSVSPYVITLDAANEEFKLGVE